MADPLPDPWRSSECSRVLRRFDLHLVSPRETNDLASAGHWQLKGIWSILIKRNLAKPV